MSLRTLAKQMKVQYPTIFFYEGVKGKKPPKILEDEKIEEEHTRTSSTTAPKKNPKASNPLLPSPLSHLISKHRSLVG